MGVFTLLGADAWAIILAGLCVLVLGLLIWMIIITVKFRKMVRKNKDYDLVASLEEYYQKVGAMTQDYEKKEERIAFIEKTLAESPNRIGIVKYNAFGDGDAQYGLSFSLAVLNSFGSGYVLNSIYGREGSNIYMKKVINGKTERTLTGEEQEAIERAMKNSEWGE